MEFPCRFIQTSRSVYTIVSAIYRNRYTIVRLLINNIVLVLCLAAGPALASDMIIYPAKGQSQDQQQKDEYECYQWAKGQTGFDPMQQPQATAPPPADTSSSTGGGLLRGALVGAAVGGIADGSDGAGKGAAIGGLLGGARSRSQQRQYEAERDQWAQQQAAQYQAGRNQYNRAFAACMEPRGYSIR